MFDVLLGASGGIVGVLGALFKHTIEVYQERKKAEAQLSILKETNTHELNMAAKHAELIKLEADNAVVLAELNRTKEFDVASLNTLTASYDNDKAAYSDVKDSKWMIAVDVARGLIRPALTTVFSVALIACTILLWFEVPAEVVRTEQFLSQTLYRLIDALIFLSTSSVGWWFAARQITK